MNRIKKITLFLLVFTLVFASAFFLVACNEQQEDEGDITRDLYVYAIAFEDAGATEEESSAKVQADADSSADKTAIVYLTFSKTDRKIEGANALWHSEKRKDGEFYFVTTIKISLSPESIFSAVKEQSHFSMCPQSLIDNSIACVTPSIIVGKAASGARAIIKTTDIALIIKNATFIRYCIFHFACVCTSYLLL